MRFLIHIFRLSFSKSVSIFLHTSLSFISLTFVTAAAYCAHVAKSDAFLGEYMFYDAVEYVLASLLIGCISAIIIDIIERDRKIG